MPLGIGQVAIAIPYLKAWLQGTQIAVHFGLSPSYTAMLSVAYGNKLIVCPATRGGAEALGVYIDRRRSVLSKSLFIGLSFFIAFENGTYTISSFEIPIMTFL